MKEFDRDAMILCDTQAELFERSTTELDCSSEVFIRRFMNSKIAKELDSTFFLDDTKTIDNIFQEIDKEYGVSTYGKTKYSNNTIHWIGYIYRYMAYTYEIPSKRIYKMIKPKELKEVYLPYHTLDPKAAIERILEDKNISFKEEDIQKRNYEIFKRIRLQG